MIEQGALFDEDESGATLSPDGRYRYRLWRKWGKGPSLPFVMLNPSTADATADDPTIVRCRNFARVFGAGGLLVVNLYAYRATSPADLWTVGDPVGPENDTHLIDVLGRWPGVIAAWGANARADRVAEVLALPRNATIYCLGTTKAGAPRHPLYLRADSSRVPWRPPSEGGAR